MTDERDVDAGATATPERDLSAELRTLERVVAVLVKRSRWRTKREILQAIDELEAAMTNDRGYPDESQDEPDRSAPVGDRMYVPQPLLDLDGKDVTFRGVDPETGEVVEGTAPLVIAPEHFREDARRRGVDVEA
jgi:hypothetical protein